MKGFHWSFGFLLIWGIFQSTEEGKGECPDPHKIEFAKYNADQYVVGTTAVYECKTGYKRKRGASPRLKCQNHIGYAEWQTELDMCIVYPPVPSQQSATQKWEGTSSSPQATTQRVMKDFCGAPISPKYATRVSMKYYMGQKLNYVCNDGYQARTPISEVSTCVNVSGRLVWSSLTLSCKNDSSVAKEATTQLLPTDSVRTAGITNHQCLQQVGFPLVSILLYLH